ncbi:hypothetical protein FN846DRAFT_902758 [Sphaerosporella brunnea]|uniref:Uncharacterized protein n=1 Tax=Sphaerosporella brunnea TaxID=1250544 RepID=A0A5J5F8U8_9PEZI|nr:hypothetical protein FN846DRAFT_902758 [Sphaerosporella brunnea]
MAHNTPFKTTLTLEDLPVDLHVELLVTLLEGGGGLRNGKSFPVQSAAVVGRLHHHVPGLEDLQIGDPQSGSIQPVGQHQGRGLQAHASDSWCGMRSFGWTPRSHWTRKMNGFRQRWIIIAPGMLTLRSLSS